MASRAACPRCGANVRAAEARFCGRCGLPLSWAEPGTARLRSTPPPVVPPIPAIYPPPASPLPFGGPPPFPGKRQPAAKSRSGCGCLLSVLLVFGVFITIGRLGSRPRPVARPVAAPGVLVATEAAPGALPARPAFPFVAPPTRTGPYRAAEIRGATVSRSSDGPGWQRVRATVHPGGRERTLLVVYFVDQDGATISRSHAQSGAGHGDLAVGTWLDDPERDAGRAYSADVDLPLPSGLDPDRLRQGRAQFSLFDEGMTEVARATVRLPSSGRPERSR